MCVRPLRLLPAALAAFALWLAVPALSLAAPVQFGSPLTPGPVVGFGCEAEPTLIDTAGNYGLVANAKGPDCTWRQAGVWGLETDPRVSSVPGDGRIIRAEILSGPNPAPVRISVLRQIGTGGFAGQCCFFVTETPPVPLVPNAITTIPLDIPVERNTLKGFLAADLLGISATVGTGTLPLRVVGSANIFNEPIGNSRAGAFYPRIGSNPNDSGGGRREEGVPGLEVLVRWTWCGRGDASCDPAVRTAPAPAPAVTPTAPPAGPAAIIAPTLARQLAQVRENQAFVRLLCGSDAACQGRLELVGNPVARRARAAASAAKPKKPAKPIVYGSAGYKISAGARSAVAVKLNRRGRAVLGKHPQATVTLRVLPKGGTPSSSKLTLSLTGKASGNGSGKRAGKGS